ncbi:MAG TPA: hypothetical protein VGC86_08795 [Afipia sp.]
MDDASALRFLQSRVPIDLNASKEVQLTKPFTKEEYDARTRLRHGHFLYDEVFILLGAGQQPLHVATPVVDGNPQVQFASEIGDPNIYLREDMTGDHKMDDWLIKYTEGNVLNIPALIKDDYFSAIKITYNAKHYVSSMKLLVSAIDSLSYIEYGDGNGRQTVFEKWLSTYADLSDLSITPQELWELRNGLLHMSNLHSRQVNKKAVRQISFHVGIKPYYERDGIHFFSFYGLISAVAKAIQKWIETYNADREKMVSFVSRYDKTISDSRLAVYTGGGA